MNMSQVATKELLLHPYLDNSKHEATLEIIDVYKIKDYNNEYIAKIRKID